MGSFVLMLCFIMHFKVPVGEKDGLFFAFVGCIILINSVYMFIYGNDYPGEFRFHMSIVYYVYNLFIVITFRQLSLDIDFLRKLRLTFQAALIVQLVVAFTGMGRYGSMRYMGTFNDPNQCGFYIFASFLMIFIISHITKEGHPFIWYVVAFILIMRTVSTGMMLGMAVLLAVYVFLKISEFNKKSTIAFMIVAGGLLVIFALYSEGLIRLPDSIVNTTMYQRVIAKVWSFGVGSNAVNSGGLRNLFVDRCWDRLLDYPTKILYGAGEGYYNRFPSARFTNNEVHSSILGPLFYYGIFPCSIWFAWTVNQIKGIKRELWAAYLALIIESITLVNNRQPFFWMIFVLAGNFLAKGDYETELEKNQSIYAPVERSLS